MSLFKNQKSTSLPLSLVSPKVQAELLIWQRSQFYLDMDKDSSNGSHDSSPPRNVRRTRSSSISTTEAPESNRSVYPGHTGTQDAALLAQFAAAASMSSHGLPPTIPYGSYLSQGGYSSPSSGFNDHLFNHGDMGHTQLPPLSSLDFPWHNFPPQLPHQSHLDHLSHLQRTMPASGSSSSYPYGGSLSIPSDPPDSPNTGRSSTNPAPAPAPSQDLDLNQTEGGGAMSEEKRRRNTAASARFRIKKKQRITNLERSVNDLTGRAEDLEREAADLRRENGWLKEIVMLKGSRLAGANLASHILAESAAQQAAETPAQPSSSISGFGGRVNTSGVDDSSDTEEAPVSKRKGKSRKK